MNYPSASVREWVAFQDQVCVPEFGQCIFTRIKPHAYTGRLAWKGLQDRVSGYLDASPERSNFLGVRG